jgi:crotonobetaine/carnitine-CoA ligase
LAVGNHPRHFFHFLALNQLGASIVPLNPDHRAGEIAHVLQVSRAHLVVSTAPRYSLLQSVLADRSRWSQGARVSSEALAQQLGPAPGPVAALSADPWQREAAI